MNKTQYIAGMLITLSTASLGVPCHNRPANSPFQAKGGRRKFKPSHRKNQKGRR